MIINLILGSNKFIMIKHLLSFIIFFSFLGIVTAQPADDEISVGLKNGSLVINKSAITPNWQVNSITKIIGTNARIKKGSNITHTYDDLGLVLFEASSTEDKIPTGNLKEFQLYIAEATVANDVVPNGIYSGKLIIEGIKMINNLNAKDLRKKLIDLEYIEGKTYMEHNFRFSKEGVYFYAQFDETESHLLKVSFGKDLPVK